MPRPSPTPLPLPRSQVRRIWLRAQRLDTPMPFGEGPEATRAAVEHLGYVQIDTINVIERCHHHILWSRIPNYRRGDLRQAQSVDKSVFEYWTHALAYVPTRDYRYFIRDMRDYSHKPKTWFKTVQPGDLRKVMRLIRKDGALSIRDIDDDELREKDHPWASRKPSRRALQLAFFTGALTVSQRIGMLKTFELTERHFGWEKAPRSATSTETTNFLLDRALRSQGIVSLDSICHLDAPRKPAIEKLIESRVRRGELVPVAVEDAGKVRHWMPPVLLDAPEIDPEVVHILSPFDPLIIQRKRLAMVFGYEHRFEAYVPKEKRVFGYFALPVLVGDEIVAAIDVKADRVNKKLLMQKWTWVGSGKARTHKRQVETALHRFAQFQFGD